jgi:hypothetical protein
METPEQVYKNFDILHRTVHLNVVDLKAGALYVSRR